MKNDHYPSNSGQPRSIRTVAELARDMQRDINAITNGSSALDGVSQEKALRDMERAVEGVDTVRRLLALLYARAPSGTITEHAVGESLTKIRAALARMRKAVGELAQEQFAQEQFAFERTNDGEEEEDGDE